MESAGIAAVRGSGRLVRTAGVEPASSAFADLSGRDVRSPLPVHLRPEKMGRKSRTKQQHHPEPVETAPPPPAVRPIDESKLVLPICAALVILIAIIYAQVGSHSFLTYDDQI